MTERTTSSFIRILRFCAGPLFAVFLSASTVFGQNVGINTTGIDPHPSAMLDVSSVNKGVLIPRLTRAQRQSIPGPANGLMVYQVDDTVGFWFYRLNKWEPIFRTVRAGVGLTGGQIYSYGTINIANTGVLDGTYGTPDSIPRFTVNRQGQLVFAGNVALRERDSVIGNEIQDTLNAYGMLQLFGSGTSGNPLKIGVNAGRNVNDIWIWTGSTWGLVQLPREKDSIIGNELADTSGAHGMLTRTGAGTQMNPYKVGIIPGIRTGDIWQWDGSKWSLARIVHPLEQDSVIGNELADTTQSLGVLTRFGSGTPSDPFRIGVNPGNRLGQVWQWNGTEWVPATIIFPPEKDSVIGNEISDTSRSFGILTKSGSGTFSDPYKLGIRPGNRSGQVWQWNGSEWIAAVIIFPPEKDSVVGNEIADTLNSRGILVRYGSGTEADPYKIGIENGSSIGHVWRWNGQKWISAPIIYPPEKDSVIGNEIADTSASFGMLTLQGAGSASSPKEIGIQPGTAIDQVWHWTGSMWKAKKVIHPLEKDSVVGNEIADTVQAKGMLQKFGSGTATDPYKIGVTSGNTIGDIWRWNGTRWNPVPLPAEVDAVIGNEIMDTLANGFLQLSGSGTAGSPKRTGLKQGVFTGAYLRWNGNNWYSDSVYRNTLDMAYDQGGRGVGRNIIADRGAVLIEGADGLIVTGTFGTGAGVGSPGAGTRMFYNPAKGAFRAGRVQGTQWNQAFIGDYSFASGMNVVASGNYSTAMGFGSVASNIYTFAVGDSSVASNRRAIAMGDHARANGLSSVSIGKNTLSAGQNSFSIGSSNYSEGPYSGVLGEASHAKGFHSFAFGYKDTALGDYTLAMGYNSKAEGEGSVAIGYNTYTTNPYSIALGNNVQAIADRSIAMGSYVSTNNKNGSFIFGDGSTTTLLRNQNLNEMAMRFDGGYVLYSNAAATVGVRMAGGVAGWTTFSDRNMKTNITPIDLEDLLLRINGISVTKWSYKDADPNIKYIGPMAQDFYRAFQLGGTDSLGINTINIDGVNFAGIQALYRRTEQLRLTQIELLKSQARLDAQEAEIAELRREMEELKRIIQRAQD